MGDDHYHQNKNKQKQKHMAIKQITPVAKGWNNKIFFPKDNYILRCISSKIEPNSNGNRMVTLEWEIVNQAPKQIGDETIEFDGVKFNSYHVLEVKGDPEKTDRMFNFYAELLGKCGIDTSEGIDDTNPPTPKGKVVWATVYGRENASYASPTPEERAAGKKVGAIIKDPITNKDVITFQPNIETIFGLYDGEVTNPAI